MSKFNMPKNAVLYCRTTEETLTRLDRVIQRDGISRAEFVRRALIAYELMYPGPDYRPPEIRPT
jgi:Ribbon-helix-helix protein, copG family